MKLISLLIVSFALIAGSAFAYNDKAPNKAQNPCGPYERFHHHKHRFPAEDTYKHERHGHGRGYVHRHEDKNILHDHGEGYLHGHGKESHRGNRLFHFYGHDGTREMGSKN